MAAFALFVVGHLILYLWNSILVEATGVQPLTFWKALGLLLLSRILVGGFRFGSSRGPWKKSPRSHWKEKWMHMSEEERAEFRNKWKERCERK
ncbi:MAG: hypothetical protein IPL49_05660 [Saprospirales bacterium]|nr:hypothetical protein [Saprospirales bacterium]MBK8490394.1 hypothetical protein [Saprospirales bacterium]